MPVAHSALEITETIAAFLPKTRRKSAVALHKNEPAAVLIRAHDYHDMMDAVEQMKTMFYSEIVGTNMEQKLVGFQKVRALVKHYEKASPRIRPVAFVRNGKPTAFLVSAGEYQKLKEVVDFISGYDGILSDEEERALAAKAKAATKKGTVGKEESRKLINRILGAKVEDCLFR